MSSGEFSTVQFFAENSYEKIVEFVDVDTAMRVALRTISSIGGRLGTTKRVMITDGGDCSVFEWEYGNGVVWPTPEALAAAIPNKNPARRISEIEEELARPCALGGELEARRHDLQRELGILRGD